MLIQPINQVCGDIPKSKSFPSNFFSGSSMKLWPLLISGFQFHLIILLGNSHPSFPSSPNKMDNGVTTEHLFRVLVSFLTSLKHPLLQPYVSVMLLSTCDYIKLPLPPQPTPISLLSIPFLWFSSCKIPGLLLLLLTFTTIIMD